MILPYLSHAVPGGRAYRSLLAPARHFPEDAAEWAVQIPGVPVPSSLWPCQDATIPMVDTIGSVDLASGNGSGDELAQVAGDPLGRDSIHLEDTASHLRSNTTDYDLDASTSFSIFKRFQIIGGLGRYLFRKASINLGAAATYGWFCRVSATGQIELKLHSPVGTAVTVTLAVNHSDGAFHDLAIVINRADSTISILSDLGTASASIAGHTTLTNGQFFGIGDTQGNLNHCVQAKYSYAAAWLGTALSASHFAQIRGLA